jgi:hypothetical protein
VVELDDRAAAAACGVGRENNRRFRDDDGACRGSEEFSCAAKGIV